MLCIVTVNAAHPLTLGRMIDWVQGPKGILVGDQAVQFLLAQQLLGIRTAAANGIAVRVNFQLMPSVNDHEIEDVAKAVSDAGAGFFHIQRFEPPHTMRPDFAAVTVPSLQQMSLAGDLAGCTHRAG